jgi:hypothetical protein
MFPPNLPEFYTPAEAVTITASKPLKHRGFLSCLDRRICAPHADIQFLRPSACNVKRHHRFHELGEKVGVAFSGPPELNP